MKLMPTMLELSFRYQMASTFAGVTTVVALASSSNRVMDKNLPTSSNKLLSSFASISTSSSGKTQNLPLERSPQASQLKATAKDFLFNKVGSAIRKLLRFKLLDFLISSLGLSALNTQT